MLGARAREAEYNAFKNASARQASRQAEDQSLPPRSAPISLSAFSKATQPNRNKGTKAYKPLVIEDSTSDEPIDVHVDHVRQSETLNSRYLIDDQRAHDINTVVEQPLQIQEVHHSSMSYQGGLPPHAPRAMRQDESHVLHIANPTPRRPQHHLLASLPQMNTNTVVPIENGTLCPGGMLPYTFPYWHCIPENLTASGSSQMPSVQSTDMLPIMRPDVLSPCKQEEKFAKRAEIYRQPDKVVDISSSPVEATRTRDVVTHHGGFPPSYPQPVLLSMPYILESGAFTSRSTFQHFAGDNLMQYPTHSPYRQTDYPLTNDIAQMAAGSYHNAGMFNNGNMQIQNYTAYTPGTGTRRDRTGAKQQLSHMQAAATTAKTVLRNPDLQKATSTPGTVLADTSYYQRPIAKPSSSPSALPGASPGILPRLPSVSQACPPSTSPPGLPQQDPISFSSPGQPRLFGRTATPMEAAALERVRIRGPPPNLPPSSTSSTPSQNGAPKRAVLSESPLGPGRAGRAGTRGSAGTSYQRLPVSELEARGLPAGITSPAAALCTGTQETKSDDVRDRENELEPEDGPVALSDFAHYFGVGEDSWYELKPASGADRQKMRDVARAIEEEDKFRLLGPLETCQRRMGKGSGWLQPIPTDATMERVSKVAQDYAAELEFESEVTSVAWIGKTANSVKAIGKVMANVADYTVQHSLPKDRRDPFATFNPVPEYAIDHRNSTSVFECEGNGFVKPPSRIARDPRFRSDSERGSPNRGFGRLR